MLLSFFGGKLDTGAQWILHMIELALYILVAGILCIYINYDCDRQRQEFRRTNGKALVWGKAPSKITASYTTTTGETKSNILFTSGWWGLARHFHYVPEISAAFFWTVPALFDHAKRDDDRCRSKYENYWKVYCEKVPYRVIPGIY
ncbi:7-dehydrocholesterol reductase-like isoform X3 [Cannabis sativa]|uniref:7-dehydrocholesterol reductase-like isoform X3 n=1 Tax=Cannabis sativa TaxID=3483 RepID=UPI0029CAA7F4|nr:7-dehydrocholesterol reductase-like isoform X3 [Cannabis sativa]